jgi:hypothetical protein
MRGAFDLDLTREKIMEYSTPYVAYIVFDR